MPASEIYKYNLNALHRVFLGAVLAFTGATVLVIYKDHNDEWRNYQREFIRIESSLLEQEISAVKSTRVDGADFETRIADLKSQQAALVAKIGDESSELQALSLKVEELEKDFLLQGRKVRFQRAKRDVARANLDLAVRDALPEDNAKAVFDKEQLLVDEYEKQWESIGTLVKQAKVDFSNKNAARAELADKIKKVSAELSRPAEALDEIQPADPFRAAKRAFMEWPIVDGFHGHLSPKQDWLPDLKIKLGMTSTARFDRCRTCHLGIDRFGAKDVPTFPSNKTDEKGYPQPFSSHPRPELYLTATSPHPIATFGCTVCHDGAGSATSFLNAQHGANDPVTEHKWEQKHGHYYNHFWEYPMFPARLRDAACVKCHHDVIELGVNEKFGATAPKAYEGWTLISQMGCFGCHEINGYEGKRRIGPDIRLEPSEEEAAKYAADQNLIPGTMRKVGPSLKHIAQKTTAEWISFWTKEPKRFRPTTRMPQFFGLSNLGDHEGMELSTVELKAVGEFLISQSTPVLLIEPRAGVKPDATRGKKGFAEKGCVACHSHDDPEFKGMTSTFGPNLTGVGKKLRPDKDGFKWLYSWIRNPEKYHPRTKMPQLFINSDEEATGVDTAADITAFLLDVEPTEYKTDEVKEEAVTQLLRMQLSGRVMTDDQFETMLKERKWPANIGVAKGDEENLSTALMSGVDQSGWNVEIMRYLGRRTVSRYGCYGCHDINGYGSARPIGTSLADWGRKDTGRLAFEHIEEFLHHHGEADGSSTSSAAAIAMKTVESGVNEDVSDGIRTAYYFENLQHHGRAGFLFQKLRDPRSYDYKKTSTKRYNERLVMPKFPLNDAQIEAIANFVLGLVADPPAPKYVYAPGVAQKAINKGEGLLRKYNCISCHATELDRIRYPVEDGELQPSSLAENEHQFGLDALIRLQKPYAVYDGSEVITDGKRSLVAEIRGMTLQAPTVDDEPDDRNFIFDAWTTGDLTVPGTEKNSSRQLLLPSSPEARLVVQEKRVIKHAVPESGPYFRWLTNRLRTTPQPGITYPALSKTPPVLVGEGAKVHSDWLYKFLLNPSQIRYTTVLRMPRFNMSNVEAEAFAAYFAAKSGNAYPFESGDDGDFVAAESDAVGGAETAALKERRKRHDDESWKMLTTTLCIKCHGVGGRPFSGAANDPLVTRAPNLQNVQKRLRADWVLTWVSKPQWISPYTSMPLPFPNGKSAYAPLFDGDAGAQTNGVYHALINYDIISEQRLKLEPLAEGPK